MNAYDAFASAYDALNTEIDYAAMADGICRRLADAGIAPGALVLDLGCGTGTLTRILAERGYDMIGVDGSEEMLAAARAKGSDGILWLEQELTEFELYGTVAAIVSTTDTLNHITDEADLRRVFSLAHNYLDPDGLFISISTRPQNSARSTQLPITFSRTRAFSSRGRARTTKKTALRTS